MTTTALTVKVVMSINIVTRRRTNIVAKSDDNSYGEAKSLNPAALRMVRMQQRQQVIFVKSKSKVLLGVHPEVTVLGVIPASVILCIYI